MDSIPTTALVCWVPLATQATKKGMAVFFGPWGRPWAAEEVLEGRIWALNLLACFCRFGAKEKTSSKKRVEGTIKTWVDET